MQSKFHASDPTQPYYSGRERGGRLAALFDAVTGLDPDAEMLAAAARAAAERGIGNASWVRLRAEDLPAGLGRFRVVTFAASFHWMDRPRVTAAVAGMLDPDGAVVQVDTAAYRAGELAGETGSSPLPFAPPPEEALDQQTVRVPDGRILERSADDLVAGLFSLSSTAPHLFGGRRADYERAVRDVLARASPSGRFSVRLPDSRLRIWRRPA